MTRFRFAMLIVAAAASTAVSAAPGRAVDFSAGAQRSLSAGFHLPTGVEMTLEAFEQHATTGNLGGAPAQVDQSQACFTVTPAGGAAQTLCGPAQIHMAPDLSWGTVTGAFSGIEFDVRFAADPSGALAPDLSTFGASATSVGASRSGVSAAQLVGAIFGAPQTAGSSWYAEVKEKVASSTSGT